MIVRIKTKKELLDSGFVEYTDELYKEGSETIVGQMYEFLGKRLDVTFDDQMSNGLKRYYCGSKHDRNWYWTEDMFDKKEEIVKRILEKVDGIR